MHTYFVSLVSLMDELGEYFKPFIYMPDMKSY